MSVTKDLLMLGRMAAALPGFLRRRIDLDHARAIIRRRLDEREERFLALVEGDVFGNPRSPYLPLLRAAGCELGDLRSAVRNRGLETALEELRDAGVYVTFEEFKGREPLERNGVVAHLSPSDFDNPRTRAQYTTRSTGSTGTPTEIPHDLDHVTSIVPYFSVAYDAYGVLDAPLVLWRCAPPLGMGLTHVLRGIVMGQTPRRWFEPMGPDDVRVSSRDRIATSLILGECRLLGHQAPSPEPVPFERAVVIARYAAETVEAEGSCLIRAGVSMCLRIALAAIDDGLSLEGVTFVAGGEPPTEAKVEGMRRSGAVYYPSYAASDIGMIGLGCANPADESDVHLTSDGLALIPFPREVPGTDRTVDAFCFTSLLPTASKILLNVEVDDSGIVERRDCGCALGELGFDTHLRRIRSHRKLTGEGINLVDTDMVRILEEVLPSRFGGDPQDYQLHEREDDDGYTRLVLVVDPRVDIPADDEVIGTVLESLRAGSIYEDSAREHWQQAGSFRIERRTPEWTGRGKFPPLVVHRL